MSEKERTLMQVFQLLKVHFKDYTNILDTETNTLRKRRNKGWREARNLKCKSCPTSSKFFQSTERTASPIAFQNNKEETLQNSFKDVEGTDNVPVLLDSHPKDNKDDSLMLSIVRENAEMKIKMQEVSKRVYIVF